MTAVRKSADRPPLLLRLTVAQYRNMIASGILAEGEPYELLDGVIVRKDRSAGGADPMTVGYEHALVVKRLAALDAKLGRLGCHIQTQQPITIPPSNEPEPDAAVVLGTPNDYRGRHPGAADVTCVIEVADSSLTMDRTTKLAVYARAGIPTYMIVNLVGRTIEVNTEPARRAGRYAQTTTLKRVERVELPAAKGRTLAVAVKQIIS